jgi:BlaI family penicillinase repressor
MPQSIKQPLSELENRVLQVIWERKTATAEDVRLALAPEKVLKDSTVRTVLRRLEQKGYATHTVEGQTFHYAPTASALAIAAGAIRRLIDQFCQGSVENLLVGMVDASVISPKKLAQLSKKIAESKERGSSPSSSRRSER